MAPDEELEKGLKRSKKKVKKDKGSLKKGNTKKKKKKGKKIRPKEEEPKEPKELPSKEPKKEVQDLGVPADLLKGKKEKKDDEVPPLLCPECGHELEEGAKKCPDCGTALTEGEVIVCAICGSVIEEGFDVCLICGTKLISKDTASKVKEFPIEDFVHHGRKKRKPAVKIKGEEEIEKEKAEIEKEKEERKKAPPKKKRKKVPAKVERRPRPKKNILRTPAVVPMVVTIILLLTAFVFLVNPMTHELAVDGDFEDWDEVAMHEDTAGTVGTSITEYAVSTQDDDLFLYLRTKGKVFPGGVDSPSYVNIFIDSDQDPETGYLVNSIGAEHRIEVKGWNDEVQSAKYFSFSPIGDPSDWNDFVETGNIQAGVSGNQLEVSKSLTALGLSKDTTPAIMFSVKDKDGNIDMSEAPVGLKAGGVMVTQFLKAPATPVAKGTTGQVFMTLMVEAKGESDTFKMMKITRLGAGTVGDVSSITLWSSDTRVDDGKFTDIPGTDLQQMSLEPNLPVKVGKPVVLTLKMDIWDKASGSTIGAQILSTSDLECEDSPVALYTVQEDARISYVNNTPVSPSIDGAFGEWNDGNSEAVSFSGKSTDPNIDLLAMRSTVIKPGQVRLWLKVSGQVLGGLSMPGDGTPPSCGPSPICPNSGEDVIIVYLDADGSYSTGKQVGEDGASVGAEYAVIIQGKYGIVDGSSVGFYDYDSGKGVWERLTEKGVKVDNDEHRMEIEVDFGGSGLVSQGDDHHYLIELRDPANESVFSSVIH